MWNCCKWNVPYLVHPSCLLHCQVPTCPSFGSCFINSHEPLAVVFPSVCSFFLNHCFERPAVPHLLDEGMQTWIPVLFLRQSDFVEITFVGVSFITSCRVALAFFGGTCSDLCVIIYSPASKKMLNSTRVQGPCPRGVQLTAPLTTQRILARIPGWLRLPVSGPGLGGCIFYLPTFPLVCRNWSSWASASPSVFSLFGSLPCTLNEP